MRAFKPVGVRAASRTDRNTAGIVVLVEPLSDRELEVLGLLAAGKSNQQIADELFVVLDTVKKHVGHILDKLGAANRTQAVARARTLELLR
jgi:LuxR family transcriptional regulator, maltose regulon positive regulatory protein